MPYPWRRHWREGGVGGGGVGGAKHVGKGRVQRLFRIHELARRNL